MIDPNIWLEAEQETAFHRSQVQEFLYGDEAKGRHVLRDLCQSPGAQVIWECSGENGEQYTEAKREMDRRRRLYEIGLISKSYAALAKSKTE